MKSSDLEMTRAEHDVVRSFVEGARLETGELAPWLISLDDLSRALFEVRERAKMTLDTPVSGV